MHSIQTAPARASRTRSIQRGLAACLLIATALIPVSVLNATSEPIQPLPLKAGEKAEKVALGRQLFHDRRLSGDNSVSCASCHDLAKGGVDGRRVSVGVGGASGVINSPTVFNSGFNFRQFWDGRANTLEQQADGPVHDPREMATDWPTIVGKLSGDAKLDAEFKRVYGRDLDERGIKDALASFQRSLITPNSRFDRYLQGKKDSLSADEAKGYELFKNYGCIACHQGVNIGGNMFQVFGVMNDYFAERGNPTDADLGRFRVTGNERDRHMFKVPSLRNVAVTAPYLHDGSAKTLRAAVDAMFRYQLGRTAPDEDKELIVGFLRTLTGEYQGVALDKAR